MIDDENLVSYYGWGEVTDPAFVDEPDPYAIGSFPTYTQMGGGTPPVDEDAYSVYNLPEDPAEWPVGEVESIHAVPLNEAYFRITFEEGFTALVDPGPSDEFEAIEHGNERLAEIIQNMTAHGITLESVGDTVPREIENWGANDWQWTARLRIIALSPWQTYTTLGDLGVSAVEAIDTLNLIDSVAPSVPVVGGDYGETPRTVQLGGDVPPDILSGGAMMGSVGLARTNPYVAIAYALVAVTIAGAFTVTTVAIMWEPDEIQDIAESFGSAMEKAATPIAVVLIIYLASKL